MSTPFVTPAPPALLLVEGRTLLVFFEEWLRRLGKPGVKVIDFGGISQLNGTLQRVADPVFLTKVARSPWFATPSRTRPLRFRVLSVTSKRDGLFFWITDGGRGT